MFQWSTLNGLCPASTDQVTLFRDLLPSVAMAGIDTATCLTNMLLQAVAPITGSGLWAIVSGSGTLNTASLPHALLSGLNAGITTLQWTVSNGVCPTSTDQVSITTYTSPVQAFAGIDEAICSDSLFLVGNTSSGSAFLWEVLSGSADLMSETTVQTTAENLSPGIILFRYTITNGPCSTSDSVAITRFELPSAANAGSDTFFCSDVFFTQAIQPSAGQGVWTSLTPGVSFDDSTEAQTSVSNLPAGYTALVWTVQNGTCPVSSDTLELQRDIPTEMPVAMADTGICAATLLLQAQAPLNATGYWEILSGDVLLQDSSLAQTVLNFTTEGNAIVVWTLSEGACLNSDTVSITQNFQPFPVDAGLSQGICGLETGLLALTPQTGNGTWSMLASDGELSDPEDPSALLSVDYPGIRRVVWLVENGSCSAADTVTINFLEQPVADSGPDLVGCLADTTALQAGIPLVGVGTWTSLTAGGNVFEPGFQNSGFTVNATGNFYLRWTVVNGICRDSATTVVTIYGPSDPECSGPDVVFIPEGFSPNGDGVFDRLEIVHPSGKRTALEVFDRYGLRVYENENYQNEWEGTVQSGILLQGSELPEGTYYYLIRIEGEPDVRKGYITLWR